MPHDTNGVLIKEGDIVTVDFVVKQVQPGEEFCNLNLETVRPMFPAAYKSAMTLNAKQVSKVEGSQTCNCS